MIQRVVWLTVLVLAQCLNAADETAGSLRDRNRAAVDRAYQENTEKQKDNTDLLVLPGLVADRKLKRVTVHAETTTLHKDEIAEFFLITQNSGHDYESLAVSFAKPSDIHKALEFIGLEAGKPCNEGQLQFWPKGERVIMHFSADSIAPIRAEKLIVDDRTGKSLPERGLVFTGSALIDSTEAAGTKVYAADARGPNSIASSYNEPQTVLDVPYHFPQAVVYQHLCLSSNFLFPSNSLIQVILEPEYKDGRKRVADLRLDVSLKPDTTGASLNDVSVSLLSDGKALNQEPTLQNVLQATSAMAEQGRDPFVTLQLQSNLTLRVIHDLAVLLVAIDTEKGIRMEPPLPGQLYYKAFAPDPAFLDRQTRIAQPWELTLSLKDSAVSGVLTQIEQVWKDEQVRPDLKVTDYDVATPEALKQALDKHGPGLPVILVKAPPSVTHQQLMNFLAPVLKTHSTIHVFLNE